MLTSAADVERFMVAGKAKLTVVSQRTGARFTFSFRRPAPEPGKQRPVWISLLSGPDNGADYSFVGTMWPGLGWSYRTSGKTKVQPGAPSRVALDCSCTASRKASFAASTSGTRDAAPAVAAP